MSNVLGYKTTSRVPIGFYFCIFIFFLNSMKWWLGWEGRDKWINAATVIMLFASLYNYYYIKFDFSKRNLLAVTILTISYLIFFPGDIKILIYFAVYGVIICLNVKYQRQCLHYIFKWFAWLMIPSIVAYILVQLNVMPSFGTLHIMDDVVNTYYPSEYTTRSNYIFYCYSTYYGIRFNGMFVEAGHLGMMVAFLLFADGYLFKKWETWIMIITILLTMSLAGIILVFFGYIFMKYEQKAIKFSFIITIGLIMLFVYLFGIFYNGGNNFVNEWVLSRLEYDEEKGFSGNNRFSGQIELYFASMFNNTQTMLFGYEKDLIDYLAWHKSRGNGFVMCMVKHGIVGTVAGILFYVFYTISYHKKKTALVFLLFVILMYWQRTYPFWFSWILCFVFGINNRNSNAYENRNSYISPQPQLRCIATSNSIA